MRRRSYYLVGMPLLLAALVAVAGCGAESAPGPTEADTGAADRAPSTATTAEGTPAPSETRRSTLADLGRLGVIGEPSQSVPPGLRVKGFTSSGAPSPLQVMGVREGDVITGCNGHEGQVALHIGEAIDGLQRRGEPITLEIVRDGKAMTLTRSEKLPAVKPDK